MPERRRARTGGRGPERPQLPHGPVEIPTGTVELVPDRDDPSSVTVLVNGVPSSHIDLDDPQRLDFEYMQQMAAVVRATTEGPLDVLHLGAGACSFARWVEAERPGSHQVAVDVDPVLLEHVRRWFGLPRSPRLRLRPGDAREVLGRIAPGSQDVVVRDVFAGDTTPEHLIGVELVREVSRVLRPGGLYLVNCADRPPLTLARREAATLRTVLADVVLVAEPAQLRGRRYGNVVLAGRSPGGPAGPDLGDPALERVLRSLPVPVRVLHGAALTDFVAGAQPLHDPAPWVPAGAPATAGTD